YAPLPIVSLNANVLLVPFFVSDCQIPISGHLGLTDTSSQAEIQEFERFLIAKLTVDELYRKTYSSKSLPVVVAAVSPSPLAEAPPPAASVVKAPPPAARRAPVKRGGGPSDEQGFEVVATASSASKTAVAAPPAASGARRALVKRGGSPSDEQALQVGATAARGLGAELLRLGEKSISSASETAVAASRVNVAMQAALAATVDIQTQLQLAIMSKFMSSIKDFQEYQVALMQEAAQAARDGNYFTDGMNLEILDKVAAVLPADLREVFRQNISSKEDASGGVVMSYNSADGKIHINYAMLRAMFFDKEGNIQNTELLEVFVRHEFRHKDYAESSNQVKRAIHAIPSLEEFIISMGDIYDWTRLNPQTEAVQVGYEQAIRFLISEIPYIQAAANIGYETAKSVAATQATYYRTIEDGVIELIAPIYAQDPAMFAKTDDKKSLRLVVVDSADGAQTSAFNQAKILRDNGYSTAVVEHISSITDVAGCYKMPVNVSFTANGTDLVYDVYVRQVDGIHIIGLKLKSDISVELNTSQNFAAAALSFASDVNTNRVLRNSFNALKKDAALMYGVTSNLEINPTGIAMINFVGFPTEFAGVASSHLSTFGGDSPSVISSLAGESETESWVKGALTGVYVATDQEIAESNLTTIDQNIKAEQLYKLDQQEKYYQISVRSSKIDTRFVEKAVWAKKKEGATAIILDVTNDIDLNDSATKERLTLAATTIRALGLRATIKIDVSKLTGNFIDVFNTLFELGFDGISIEAVNVENIETLKSALDALKASSAANAIEARNTMHLKDENIKEQLFAVLETEINNYNTLFITEFDIETGEALIAAQKALEASRRGYERGRRAADTNIVVRAANIRALSSIITRDFSIITAAQLRQAVRTAGVNTEIAKHIGRVLNGVSDDARGTESIIEAVGFVRGIVESCLTNQYMQAFDITQEIFDMNEMSDRESLGVMLTALFVAKPEVFESPASLRTYFDEANSSLINSPNGQMSLLEQRKGVIRFVNSLVEEFELAKQVADKTDQIQTLTISLAIINESMNKISFSRIIEETKKRAKISSATIRNILRAA
ncbi:MAG: hypothetical protein LBT18_05655, partial [Endomicrobium sp.]|nr:hypothetical protein [Endomicrobium sp.]